MNPELSLLVNLDRAHLADVTVNTNKIERQAVADRLGLVSITRLCCRFQLQHLGGDRYGAKLHLQAEIIQTCSITAEPFPAKIDEKSDVIFVPQEQQTPDLDPDQPDEVPYQGHQIDLGEATVEQLALAMDSFPQKPGAHLPDMLPEPANDHPFAKLADWRPSGDQSEDQPEEP